MSTSANENPEGALKPAFTYYCSINKYKAQLLKNVCSKPSTDEAAGNHPGGPLPAGSPHLWLERCSQLSWVCQACGRYWELWGSPWSWPCTKQQQSICGFSHESCGVFEEGRERVDDEEDEEILHFISFEDTVSNNAHYFNYKCDPWFQSIVGTNSLKMLLISRYLVFLSLLIMWLLLCYIR